MAERRCRLSFNPIENGSKRRKGAPWLWSSGMRLDPDFAIGGPGELRAQERADDAAHQSGGNRDPAL